MPSLSRIDPAVVLDEDTVDDLLYLARTDSLSELQEDLSALSTKHATSALAVLLATADSATGNTPAHLAAANGHIDVLDFLKSLAPHSAALLARTNDAGSSPLHYAAVNAKIDAVKALVEAVPHGAEREAYIRAKNGAGRDAAGEAESAGHDGWEEVVGFLLGSVDAEPEGDEALPPPTEEDDVREGDVEGAQEELEDLNVKN